MIKNKRVLAVIPARGGSVGIPRKNIRPLLGQPLIAYTIEEAKKCRHITRTIFSTDSQEIAAVAKDFGAQVPFLRPAELATSAAISAPAIRHALDFAENEEGVPYDYIIMLQPTTPLRSAQHIDACIETLHATGCDSVVSVVDVGSSHPARMYTIEDGRLKPVMNETVVMMPRQELPPVYIRSGAVYACTRALLVDHGVLMGKDCRPTVLSPIEACNIDDPIDFIVAEHRLKQRRNDP